MKRELKDIWGTPGDNVSAAHKANPYEKGTESFHSPSSGSRHAELTKLIPMKRELKVASILDHEATDIAAHKANPYEKGTESEEITLDCFFRSD